MTPYFREQLGCEGTQEPVQATDTRKVLQQAEYALWVCSEHNALHHGGQHNTVTAAIDARNSVLRALAALPVVEPAQAGELPPLPHGGWPARFRCDSCDGNGEIGELISMGHFQPPERQTCPDCGGRGWSDEGPAFNADHMRAYARASLAARKPLTGLTREQMEAGRHQVFSTNNPFCPCDSKTFRKVSEWTEREFCRINGLEVKP